MDYQQIIEAAKRRGAEQAEVFGVESEETPVRFEANRLKGISGRRTSGAALRVIAGGRIGFASSTRPGDVEGLVEAAIETAPFGPEAKFEFPGAAECPEVDVYDQATEALSLEEMIELGQSLIDTVRRMEPDILCDGSVRKAVQNIVIVNSQGGQRSYRRSHLSAGVAGTLIRGTDMLFVGDGDASCRPDLDRRMVESSIARQLEYGRRSATARTGELPVIFTPIGVAEALAQPLLMAFSGRTVYQGQSPLAGKLGEEMYDRRVSLWDDATQAYRASARPFDDGGVPSRRIPLIESGVVRSFTYDLQTAGLAKAESTGSAERSLGSPPGVGHSCIIVDGGEASFEEMVRGVSEGLVVEELMGAGQGNVMGGDFSGNVLLGYKIENGEIVGRVKDTVVAGNIHQALKRVVAIGRERRWLGGSMLAPALWFDRLSVSARG